ncbi:MAG: ribonuclease D [Albidovulum sp.]|nr:ribonuclease D [Albidovulum sp.]MDE0305243.1 ribonuclease D [Albidovulum sp.]MDE0532395.1 ribonuclease D [Albidovulum sp.]
MRIITSTSELEEFCEYAGQFPFIAVDTEFLRERTYFAILCLIQLAVPDSDEKSPVVIDPVEGNVDLAPLFRLLADSRIVKVFHAGRQDLEIFYRLGGVLPVPLFDTQVAAMVCGFGDQVGYEKLVKTVAGGRLDKSMRISDWRTRPLSQSQLNYAVSDVTFLRKIFSVLSDELHASGRSSWLDEEMEILLDPETYNVDPKEAWKKIKISSYNRDYLAILRELAELREVEAMKRDKPKSQIIRDEALQEIAGMRPRTLEQLYKSRFLRREFGKKSEFAKNLLDAVLRGINCRANERPIATPIKNQNVNESVLELLRVLLKAKSKQNRVAERLIASAADLREIASGSTTCKATKGWRYEVFGADALRVARGELALATSNSEISLVKI